MAQAFGSRVRCRAGNLRLTGAIHVSFGGNTMSTMLRFVAACAIASTLLLVGCVSAPPRQAFNRTGHPDIKTIYVLPEKPVDFTVFMMNNPAGSFGLIGALIASGQQAAEEKDMREFEQQADFHPALYFKDALTRDMQGRGYQLIWPDQLVESGKPDRDAFGLRKEYSPITNADAILDVAIDFFGYAAAGAGKGSPYRPTVSMGARLIGRDGKQNLFTDFFVYNNVFNAKQAITLDANPQYVYAMYSDLKAAGAQSMEGLKQALDAMSAALAKQL